jgi:hypothetical protein
MRDKDSKNLESIYESVKLLKEDEAGRPYPAYGSNAASGSTPVMGTEPLIQRDVELPYDANEESDYDDEDDEGLTPLQKLLNDIKNTINDYEYNKQLRFNKELEEESYVNEALSDIIGGAANFAGGAIGGAAKTFGSQNTGKAIAGALGTAGNLVKAAWQKWFTSTLGIIGEKDKSGKTIVPEDEGWVAAVNDAEIPVLGRTYLLQGTNTKYEVQLTGAGPKTKDEYERDIYSKHVGIISPYIFATKLVVNKKGEVVGAAEIKNKPTIVVLDKKIYQSLSDEDKKQYTNLRDTEQFEIGKEPIKWLKIDIGKQELTTPKDKPAVGETFDYKGITYVADAAGWGTPSKTDPTKVGTYLKDPLKTEVKNAWLASK